MMATVSNLKQVSGSANAEYKDSITLTYLVEYDSVQTNFYAALVAAQFGSPDAVPVRRSAYGGTLIPIFVQSISGQPTTESRKVWEWMVTFGPPPDGEPPESFTQENPLLRPPVLNVDYMDREYVVESAKNVEALSHGDGKGGNRAASTDGPIVNAAGKRPDEPIVETERLEVLSITRNYSTLAEIVNINRTYKRTTNSDAVVGYQPRQLRYLLTESVGVQNENEIEFWPGVTTILAEDTTDLQLDNVGYEYWDAVASDWKRAVDKDGEAMADPINLKLDGDKAGDNSTTITYRHLTEAAYASLVT